MLEHPVRLAGSDTVIAGIHAVCTDPDHRGRGLCRRLMQAAVEWAAPRFPLMELSTGSPPVYRSAGFTLVRTYRFAARPVGGAPTPVRPMNLDDPADLALLRRRLADRAPVSDVYATRDPGWMTIIDAALAGVTATWFHDAPALDAVLVAERTANGWVVHDLITSRLPGRLPPLDGDVVLRFAPDLRRHPQPMPTDELMVRGPWPALPPFGVPALWEH